MEGIRCTATAVSATDHDAAVLSTVADNATVPDDAAAQGFAVAATKRSDDSAGPGDNAQSAVAEFAATLVCERHRYDSNRDSDWSDSMCLVVDVVPSQDVVPGPTD